MTNELSSFISCLLSKMTSIPTPMREISLWPRISLLRILEAHLTFDVSFSKLRACYLPLVPLVSFIDPCLWAPLMHWNLLHFQYLLGCLNSNFSACCMLACARYLWQSICLSPKTSLQIQYESWFSNVETGDKRTVMDSKGKLFSY